MGRGNFANQTWRFLSRNPLDYRQLPGCHGQVLGADGPAATEVKDMTVPAAVRVLSLLQDKGPLPTKTISAILAIPNNCVRAYLSRLRMDGLAHNSHTVGKTTFYGTTHAL